MSEEHIYCAYEQRSFPKSQFKTTDEGVVLHVGPEDYEGPFTVHTTLGEKYDAERLPGTPGSGGVPDELHALY